MNQREKTIWRMPASPWVHESAGFETRSSPSAKWTLQTHIKYEEFDNQNKQVHNGDIKKNQAHRSSDSVRCLLTIQFEGEDCGGFHFAPKPG
ncbi:MAG: hypothetical protein F4X91_15800 [Nitrospinae bacterium]|nr:hypothetical protein [Nitrospinota bacterium]